MLFIVSVALVTTLLLYAYHSLVHYQSSVLIAANNVLLLTAHPDDECMFFGPTLTSLRTLTNVNIYVLCLSTGNAEGLGFIRKKELQRSCQVFGILPIRVKALDHPNLQDGMTNDWSPELIANQLEAYCAKNKIDTIITFDDYGVSGHPNHVAAYKGAKHFVATSNSNVQLYRLASIILPRKYIGVIDLPFTGAFESKKGVFLMSPPGAYLQTHKAMRQHISQLVWFRWLYVTFSRYMFVNLLIPEQTEAQ